MTAGNEMRVGDAEREAAAAELREHFASGRLDQEELDARLSAAFAAKTRGDLNAVFTDLPSSGPGWANAGAAGGGQTAGSFGPGAPGAGQWARQGAHSDWQAWGRACGRPVAAGVGRFVFTSVLLGVLFVVGVLGVFGIGSPRPFGVVLVLAAFALLRRLLFMIFGKRGMRRGGPRRRRF